MSDETFECIVCRDRRQIRIDDGPPQPCIVCRPAAAVPEAQDGRAGNPRRGAEGFHDGDHDPRADYHDEQCEADVPCGCGIRASAAVREGERERLAAIERLCDATGSGFPYVQVRELRAILAAPSRPAPEGTRE